ncbi:hypothetical protein CYMTET_20306 [Cymbomonas tetramitiformis]|uniref:Uncharacterized protein n=1 Tax=Cymbomonas tetramitiformis TaxID=36881 RepID=A0AAE0L4B0_9CHLO|nr:hypothetical protein CYMTET_20306 [Cymbomonas tetramitiformis]
MPADLRPVPLSTLMNLATHIFVAREQLQQAELGAAAGPSIAGAAYSGVDERVLEVLGTLTTRLEKIEAAINFQKAGGTIGVPFPSAIAAAERVKGRRTMGTSKECPYGGKSAAGGTAAYCMPADGEGGISEWPGGRAATFSAATQD